MASVVCFGPSSILSIPVHRVSHSGVRRTSSRIAKISDWKVELDPGRGELQVEIVAFSRSYDRSRFGCGKLDLDEWLKTKAGQQERANNTRTFLAIEGFRVVGYYATTVYRLGLAEVAEMRGVGKRAYPMPAVLLARLAVDEGSQANGFSVDLYVLGKYAEVK